MTVDPERLRIAFLTWRDSDHPDGGGSEVYVESLASELHRRGHQVTIFTARYPGSTAREERNGVDFIRRGGRLTVYLHGLWWFLTRQRRIDVVVDVINGLPFLTPLVRRRGVVALIHHVHAEQWRIIYPGLAGAIGWFIEGTIVPRFYRSRQFLTVSRATEGDLASLGISRDQITIARNGLRHDARPPEVPRSHTPSVCVLSRLVPHKQIEHAFDAVRQLRAQFPDLVLHVIGDGWWREQLEAAARPLVAQGAVQFHGHVSRAQRDRLLASSWAMLLPSVKEGWGLAVSEAAAQGTPTIAYRGAGGVTESISDGVTGLLVDDFDELVATTRRLLLDADLRADLGAHAQTAASALTWAACADAAEKLMLSVSRRTQ